MMPKSPRFTAWQIDVSIKQVNAWLRGDEEEGFTALNDRQMATFLMVGLLISASARRVPAGED